MCVCVCVCHEIIHSIGNIWAQNYIAFHIKRINQLATLNGPFKKIAYVFLAYSSRFLGSDRDS